MPGGQDQQRKPPTQLVSELIAAICDGRTEDVLTLVQPQTVWQPLTRPGLSVYQGHAGMTRLLGDLSAIYGRFRVDIDTITADTSTRVTVQARIVRETEHGDLPLPR